MDLRWIRLQKISVKLMKTWKQWFNDFKIRKMKAWKQWFNDFQEEWLPSFVYFLWFLVLLSLWIFGFCGLLWIFFYIPWTYEHWSIQPLAKIMSNEPGSIFGSSAAAFCGLGLIQSFIQGIVLSLVIVALALLAYLCWSSRVFLWAFVFSFGKMLRQGFLNYYLGKDVILYWPFTKSPLIVRRWSSEEKMQFVEDRLQQLCQQQQCPSTFLPENFLKTEALGLESRESIEALVTEQFQVHYEIYFKILQAPLPYRWTNFAYDLALHLYHDPVLGLALAFGAYLLYGYFFGKPPTPTDN